MQSTFMPAGWPVRCAAAASIGSMARCRILKRYSVPARAASSAKSWICSTACWLLGSATTEPARRRRVMSPLAASVESTLFTVMREQPYSAISSCSNGMR